MDASVRVSEGLRGPRVVRTVCTDFQQKVSISVINIDARLHTKVLPLVSDIIFEMIRHLPGESLDFNKGTTPCLLPPHPPPCAYPLLTYWEPRRQPHHSETGTPTPSQALGYNTFGAGGFFGDSEKAPGQWIQCWSWLSLKVSIFWGKRLQRRYFVRWKLKVGEYRCHNSEMWMWPLQSTEHGDFAPFGPPKKWWLSPKDIGSFPSKMAGVWTSKMSNNPGELEGLCWLMVSQPHPSNKPSVFAPQMNRFHTNSWFGGECLRYVMVQERHSPDVWVEVVTVVWVLTGEVFRSQKVILRNIGNIVHIIYIYICIIDKVLA